MITEVKATPNEIREFNSNLQTETIIKEGNVKRYIKPRTEEIVEDICLKSDYACKCDLMLYIEYLRKTKQAIVKFQDKNIIIIFDKLKLWKMTSPETISRIRRKLHKEKRIVYDEETEQIREKRQTQFNDTYSSYNRSKEW